LQKDLTPDERHAACSVFQLLGVQKDWNATEKMHRSTRHW
jgi:hypothetical protein